MDAVTGTRAAELLLELKDRLALEVTDALYARLPELEEKYGAIGRKKCLEDMHFNIEHLASAVDLGQPEIFAGYIEWLRDLLNARNVSSAEITHCLELTEERVRVHFTEEEVAVIGSSIQAGLAVLPPPAQT